MRQPGEERRRYARSRKGFPAVQDDGGPGVLNHIDNISATGVLCHTVKPIALMTRMSIALELPPPFKGRVECEGVVVRCEPHEVGDDHFKVAILFTRINESDRDAIHQFVEQDLRSTASEH